MKKPQFELDGIRHATINGQRFHLRLTDPSELNPIWIDGRAPLLLDQVAGEFVAHAIDAMWRFQQGEGDESEKVVDYVVKKMHRKYGTFSPLPGRGVTRKKIRSDLDRIFGTLMKIAEGDCPVESGLAMKEISLADWVAPARMDLAVTYRCNLNCGKCYRSCSSTSTAEHPDVAGELDKDKWLEVYDILWKTGVPNVVFTGGEPTLRQDLVQLVAEADRFVTGLVTNGIELVSLAEQLRDASLDYVQVTIESHDPDIHNRVVGAEFDAFSRTVEGIRRSLELGTQVTTNTTLTRRNRDSFCDLIRFGRSMGLENMSCNTLICSGKGIAEKSTNGLTADELKATLEEAMETARREGVSLQWFSPTCYKHLNPVEMGLGAKGCSAAAYNMLVQPDGTVLPCQSWPDVVGDILADPWESIWKHPTCLELRSHGYARQREDCRQCGHIEVCGGGCPLEYGVA